MEEDPVLFVTEHTRRHLLTVQEYADVVRVHPLTVYRWIREEKQRGVVRIGGRHIRIDIGIALPTILHTRA